MNDSYLDPIYLPIVPPMDLNRTPGDNDISKFPMQLRANNGGVGLFYTERPEGNYLRVHQATDLLAPIGTPVFAAAAGTVIVSSTGSVLISHDVGFRFLTYYNHMQQVAVSSGDRVGTGDKLGEVKDYRSADHLHFEIRYPFDQRAVLSRENTLPIDPTNALSQWETRGFDSEEAIRLRQVYQNVQLISLEEVWRRKQLRFLLAKVSGTNTRDLYLPLIDSSPANLSMIETLKLAFFHARSVRIIWRESLFFSLIQDLTPKAAIIAQVQVLS